ncbi:MAG: hypothetical protein J7L15_03475 [Clostridiales bacterium]|nr:hypothetical protein [Clostridiales bacterium]
MKNKWSIAVLMIVLIFVLSVSGEEAVRFVSSKTSSVVHLTTCRYAETLTEVNAEFFNTFDDAVAAGFRACKTCKPDKYVAPVVDDPIDPNTINIIPSRDANSLFPITGIVLQSEFCRRDFDPNDVGIRIIEPEVTTTTYGTNPLLCTKCNTFNIVTGEGIPEEYRIPNYISANDPNDPNAVIISSYNISPSLPMYESNQSLFKHFASDCEMLKSTPVHMVDIRTGSVAGCDAYWNPKKGILEWRITPFEIGDYVAVINSDVGQTQLIAITVRANIVQPIEEFAKYWLKGNFNMIKYSEWVQDRERLKSLLRNQGTTTTITGDVVETTSNGKIEWVFEAGAWKAVVAGANPIETIDIDTNITDNTTETRTTTISEIKVAPFEFRTNKVQVDDRTITTFDGYQSYQSNPPHGSLNYLNYQPYTDISRTVIDEEVTEADMSAHYKALDIPEPPVKVTEPQKEEKVLLAIDNIKSFTPLPEEIRVEAAEAMITEYEDAKKEYGDYIIAQAKWEKIKEEKEEVYYNSMIEMDNQRMHHTDMLYYDNSEQMMINDTADYMARIYANTSNQLTDEEKQFIINFRRRIMEGELSIAELSWDEVQSVIMRDFPDPNNL